MSYFHLASELFIELLLLTICPTKMEERRKEMFYLMMYLTFYLRLYGFGFMVEHSDSRKERKPGASTTWATLFICSIRQTGQHLPHGRNDK